MTKDLKVPEHGWVVICKALDKIAIARDPETLATAIGIFEDDVFRVRPDAESPVQVFEIGRDLSVELESLMATIRKRS